MKELFRDQTDSTDAALLYANDTVVQQERMFSECDCEEYRRHWRVYDECLNNSMLHQAVQMLQCQLL